MESFLRNQILNVCGNLPNRHAVGAAAMFGLAGGKDGKKQARFERVVVDGDILSYQVNNENKVGVFISPSPITPDNSYFEVEILDVGFDLEGPLAIGLVPYKYNLDVLPGYKMYSVGYHTGDGRIYKARNVGKLFGPKCGVGDKVGCGIKYLQQDGDSDDPQIVRVFFTKNGTELGSLAVSLPPGGFHPAVGFHCEGEVRMNNNIDWNKEDIILMAVDYGEEEWSRLHDVKLNGVVIEYVGRGKSILDVGLAQAKFPLDTTFHYFEIEIVDPGENCYIAIGVARQNYPPHRHPGWNRGSIAYHADDGKIFLGSGVGDQFGPKCHKGDIMGCGILFPPDYDSENDILNVNDEDEYVRISNNQMENGSDSDDDEDDEEPWVKANGEVGTGTSVQVFFTRNGKLIGKRKTMIPKGGFYPTIGMLSSCERVRVDLRPLTG